MSGNPKSQCNVEYTDGYVHVRFRGQPELRDILQVFAEIDTLDDSNLRLWDFVGGLDLTTAELREIADFTADQVPQPDRVAIVSAADLGYGLMRMFQAYREDAERADIRVFRNVDDARAFLLADA